MAGDDMFLQLAGYAGKGDGAVIGRGLLVSWLVA